MKKSLTRLLTEIKLINKKLDNLGGLPSADVFLNGIGNETNMDIETFKKSFQSMFDNIRSLEIKRDKIRSAIAKANIETTITITEFETNSKIQVTIYEAILYKNRYNGLLASFEGCLHRYNGIKRSYQNKVDEIDNKIDKSINQLLSNKSTQIGKDTIKKIQDEYHAIYQLELIEIMSGDEIQSKILKLKDLISEIDLLLSEVNATTLIDIED